MANFIEQIGKAPKWLLISVSAVVLGLLGYGFYYLAFGMNKPKEEEPETVLLDMPDANEETGYGESALSEFEKGKYHRNNVSDYWDSLDEEEESKAADPEEVADNLDPKVYSDYERMQIRNGIKTKDQIDREHAEAEARRQELENTYATAGGSGYSSQQSRPLTQPREGLPDGCEVLRPARRRGGVRPAEARLPGGARTEARPRRGGRVHPSGGVFR